MHDHKVNPETELAIRKEVEERFGNPPKTFIDLVDNEVEKRVELRLKDYRFWFFVCTGIVTFFFGIIGWLMNQHTHEYVDGKLSQPVIDKAIHDSTNAAAQMGLMLVTSQWTMNYFMGNFSNAMDRISELKANDNLVTVNDLSKQFVIQSVTKFVDGNKIILDYEPISHTVLWTANDTQFPVRLDFYGKLDGKVFTLKQEQVFGFSEMFTNGFKIQYIRKSIR